MRIVVCCCVPGYERVNERLTQCLALPTSTQRRLGLEPIELDCKLRPLCVVLVLYEAGNGTACLRERCEYPRGLAPLALQPCLVVGKRLLDHSVPFLQLLLRLRGKVGLGGSKVGVLTQRRREVHVGHIGSLALRVDERSQRQRVIDEHTIDLRDQRRGIERRRVRLFVVRRNKRLDQPLPQ
eukprot:7384976-Prymnesium_polylepis.1